ncbi:MAG TPA: ATP-binding protein [Aggregatilineaceae bacterium]|nr:ATP-binding protein [Aggregatilineaceae bacterium]
MTSQRTSNGYDTDSLIHRNQLLTEEIRRRVDQLGAINTVASTVSQSLNLEITLQTALDAVLNVIKIQGAGISLLDEAAGELVLRAQRGWKNDFVTQPMRIPLGDSLSGTVIHTDEVVITGDLTGDPRLAIAAFAEERVQAMAMVPMHARGRVVGILSVMNYEPYTFADEEITVLRAIADQVGVALDNARLYESTKEQASRLNAVLHSSGDAIIATDSHGNINLINSTAETLFDLHVKDLVGMPLREAPVHPKLREGLRRAMQDQEHGNTAFDVRLEDGRALSAIVSPVYSHQSPESAEEAEGWVMVVQDVTHLREAETTRMNFLHSAAHDLRNPLGAIMGSMVMLDSDKAELSQLHQELVHIAMTSVNRMQDLIDNLLNLEQVESGLGLQLKPQDVHELIERCMVDIQPHLRLKEQVLQLDVPEQMPQVLGDMHWLYRAMMNLLGNAHKYTQAGGEIIMRAYQENGELFLEVQDNGRGVPPDVQHRLFERFFRVASKERDEVRGSGLGLAIVKSVAEQHNGRVYVQSREGAGSIFGIVLPLV